MFQQIIQKYSNIKLQATPNSCSTLFTRRN